MELGTIMHAEPFVDATRAAEHLSVTRRCLLDRARRGEIPAYPLGTGKRKTWRFLKSELEGFMSQSKASSTTSVVRRTARSRRIQNTENGQ